MVILRSMTRVICMMVDHSNRRFDVGVGIY